LKPSLSLDFLKSTFPNGELISLEKKYVIGYPHQKITHFYWLLEGSINYYTILDETGKAILVSKMSQPFSPIGWGGFNTPYRFGLKIRTESKTSKFFKVNLDDIHQYMLSKSDPFLIKCICSSLYLQMALNIKMQGKRLENKTIKFTESNYENYFISPQSSNKEIAALFRRSPFMGEFDEKNLYNLAGIATRRDYEIGEEIIQQDTIVEGFYILISGEVAIRRNEGGIQVNMRSISTPGFLFGWSSLIDEVDLFQAITTTKTSVYFINKGELTSLLSHYTQFRTDFYLRLIWLIGNHLNFSFIRYLNLRLNHDITAVKNLIYNSRSRLKLASKLHQVPHLLSNLETKKLSFSILHELNKSGTSLERHIASLSLDLLKNEEKELKFIQDLSNIYEVVAENKDNPPEQTRKECAKATRKLFEHLDYIIEGKENLPESTGNIFIYNHLLNPPYYTLANNFQITLDSHFISGVILDQKYDEPGIRTVRIGKGEEYGHQNYYERLGYINVYTKDSASVSKDKKNESRSIFYKQANKFLDEKINLIISPEGISYITEESPGSFKSGAFRLALQRETKTLIIPIVMCHFDRRIPDNLFYCKILPPIDLSKQRESLKDETNLRQYVDELRDRFKSEVQLAVKKVEEIQKR